MSRSRALSIPTSIIANCRMTQRETDLYIRTSGAPPILVILARYYVSPAALWIINPTRFLLDFGRFTLIGAFPGEMRKATWPRSCSNRDVP